MFYRHVILKVNNEDVLYLYLTNAYEFAQDLENKEENNENISSRVKNYIRNRGIKFEGNKVYLVVDGIIIGTVSLGSRPKYQEVIEKENLKEFYKDENSENKIILKYQDGKTEQLSMDDYLIGVLATEIIPSFHIESIKAQAVICRTYAMKEMIENGQILDINPQQIYRNINYYKLLWTDHYFEYYEKIKRAIKETEGEYLTYLDKIIHPFYHLVSNGKTEESSIEDTPYLQSVSSIWDIDSPMYLNHITKPISDVLNRLDISIEDLSNIKILKTTKSNRINQLKIGNKVISGQNFAYLLGLNSTDISMIREKDNIHFTTRGIGHGLGMSQYGANGMAKSGYDYKKILYHYYPNTKLFKVDLNSRSHLW